MGAGRARLFIQSRDIDGREIWREPIGADGEDGASPTREDAVDAWLKKECRIDPDIWIVEIEDREGRAFLDEN